MLRVLSPYPANKRTETPFALKTTHYFSQQTNGQIKLCALGQTSKGTEHLSGKQIQAQRPLHSDVEKETVHIHQYFYRAHWGHNIWYTVFVFSYLFIPVIKK